jgi:hypothetical protein
MRLQYGIEQAHVVLFSAERTEKREKLFNG